MVESASYGLVVSFHDQSASFVHGFEAGALDQRMSVGESPIMDALAHLENEEVIRRLAVWRGYDMEWRPTDVEGWAYVTLIKARPQNTRPNPYGLHIVSGQIKGRHR